MKVKNLTVSNSRLTEGEYYDFLILKVMELGADSYFVMQDPLGYKVLMPRDFYIEYGFEPGQLVHCRVDRINCNGRMFLEPIHPHYSEGYTYPFTVVRSGTGTGLLDETEYFLIVRDVLGKEWKVRVWSEKLLQQPGSIVNCRLERIKKGKLFLGLASDQPVHTNLESGKTYSFTIVGEKVNPNDKSAIFILEDENGQKHPLRKKYFTHYGLRKGDTVKCMAEKFTSEGYFFLEPQNPRYRAGEEYTFRILELQKLNFSDGSLQDVLVLEDPHGEDIKVFLEARQLENLKGKASVVCRLLRIRKSRLELEIIEK